MDYTELALLKDFQLLGYCTLVECVTVFKGDENRLMYVGEPSEALRDILADRADELMSVLDLYPMWGIADAGDVDIVRTLTWKSGRWVQSEVVREVA